MKSIPIQLQSAYNKPTKSTCFCVKIVDEDGVAYGFTTLDARVHFDDGYHDVIYMPDQELRPANIQSTADMDTDNTELSGWFKPSFESLLLAGKLRGAEVSIYRVAYLRLNYGYEVVGYGRLGKVEYAANAQGKRKVEYRSLSQMLKDKVNDVWSLTCRADFGDDRCGMPFHWESATIAAVEDSHQRIQLSGVSQPDGYFDLGIVEFMDGPNAPAQREVESWSSDGWLSLSFVSPYVMNVGDSVRIRRDCFKTLAACRSYGNAPRMRAEPFTPVQDQSLMVPGAYIKSQNSL